MDVGTWSAPDPRTSAPEDDFLPSTPLMQSQTRLAPEDLGEAVVLTSMEALLWLLTIKGSAWEGQDFLSVTA